MAQLAFDSARTYTADEFMAAAADDPLLELVEGKLTPVCAASFDSSLATSEIFGELWSYVRAHRLGLVWGTEASFRIQEDPDTVVQPDVAFISEGRLRGQRRRSYFRGTPDLVVEVRSPSQTVAELARKMDLYLAAGTRLTWLVDPLTREVHVRRPGQDIAMVLRGGDTLSGAEVVPGFELVVAAIFESDAPYRDELYDDE